MATPKKKPNGSWEVVVFVGTDPKTGRKRSRHLTAPTKPELLRKMDEIKKETPKTIDALSLTVGAAVDAYIDRRRAELSPSTINGYCKIRHEAFPALMNLKLSALTDEVCQKAIDNSGCSPKTVVNRWNLVHAAIKEAKKNIDLSVRLPSVKRKRLDMPEADALQLLFKQIEGTPLEIPVLLAAVCGLRRSEIAALDYAKDVDYQKGLIFINKALVTDENNNFVLKDTKTTAGTRTVPCPAWVLDKLAEARDNPDYVTYRVNTISSKFTAIARQCSVNCTFHGLRHYYASIMSALNIPEQYQMERMGHSTPYMLHRYQEYLRSKEAEVNAALMSALDALDPNAIDSLDANAIESLGESTASPDPAKSQLQPSRNP